MRVLRKTRGGGGVGGRKATFRRRRVSQYPVHQGRSADHRLKTAHPAAPAITGRGTRRSKLGLAGPAELSTLSTAAPEPPIRSQPLTERRSPPFNPRSEVSATGAWRHLGDRNSRLLSCPNKVRGAREGDASETQRRRGATRQGETGGVLPASLDPGSRRDSLGGCEGVGGSLRKRLSPAAPSPASDTGKSRSDALRGGRPGSRVPKTGFFPSTSPT